MHDRIREHTRESVNKKIDRQTLGSVADSIGSTDEIVGRLKELDREWHVDRALMLNFAAIGSVSASMALRNVLRKGHPGLWGALLFVQMGFLAYHAIRGWCPPLPALRRLGYRTANEIGAEREVLHEALRHAVT